MRMSTYEQPGHGRAGRTGSDGSRVRQILLLLLAWQFQPAAALAQLVHAGGGKPRSGQAAAPQPGLHAITRTKGLVVLVLEGDRLELAIEGRPKPRRWSKLFELLQR
jgi:hypothetical protein